MMFCFVQGYSRKGAALSFLGRHNEAIDTFKAGLELDPSNPSLKDGLQEAQAAAGWFTNIH